MPKYLKGQVLVLTMGSSPGNFGGLCRVEKPFTTTDEGHQWLETYDQHRINFGQWLIQQGYLHTVDYTELFV